MSTNDNPTAATAQPPRLLDQVYAIAIASGQGVAAARGVEWCRRFVLFHGKRHSKEMGRTAIRPQPRKQTNGK